MAYDQDPQQQIGDAIQYGVIASVDHANATCTVTLGDLDTDDLPWVAQRAGGMRCWSPPTIGEQCVVLVPRRRSGKWPCHSGPLFRRQPAAFQHPRCRSDRHARRRDHRL
ncbi:MULTISPECIES: phage baseplate assembly protein V [Sphingobium]|uniref:phage baseplate assembly protein V n=1 Tax=Sphingobium TaxID=165695 RepID=UPI000262BAF3|nr:MULTISPECIES: phage baseplate assembly protein V [Sphingobium]